MECLLITFEHEFTHALIACFCYEYGHSSIIEEVKPGSKKHLFNGEFKNKGGHSKVFMTIVNKRFGHKKYVHNLFKHAEAPPKYRYLIDKMNLKDLKHYLRVQVKKNVIKFNAGDRGIIEGEIIRINQKKLKLVEYRDGKKYNWNVPYSLLLEEKSDSSTSNKSSPNNNVPIQIPISKKKKKKFTLVKKQLTKTKSTSNSTNNNKPLNIPKNKVIPPPEKNISKKSKKVTFKVKDKKTFSGPHKDKYLIGVPKEYREKFGKEKITDLDIAKLRSKELGSKSGGVTKGKNYYSVRAGKVLKDSSTGEISWLKT